MKQLQILTCSVLYWNRCTIFQKVLEPTDLLFRTVSVPGRYLDLCLAFKVLGGIIESLMVHGVKAKIADTVVKVCTKLHSMSMKRHLKKTNLHQDIFEELFFYFPFPNYRSLRDGWYRVRFLMWLPRVFFWKDSFVERNNDISITGLNLN